MKQESKLEKETLAALLENKEHQKILLSLLNGKKITERAELKKAKEVADLFVQRALAGDNLDSIYASTGHHVISKSLSFAGMNDKGQTYLEPNVARAVFDKMLPLAFGEKSEPLFNTEVNQALLDYLSKGKDAGFTDVAFGKIDEFLTPERKVQLLNRVAESSLEHNLEPGELARLMRDNNVLVPEHPLGLSAPEKQPEEAETRTPPKAPLNEGDGIALSGNEPPERSDYAEITENARKASERYQLTVERQTEALLNLNDLMNKQPDWVNRTVVDKIKTKAQTAFNKVFNQDTFVYPSESIFGETLSQVDDATGRVVNEMVRFNNRMGGFKATFSDPQVPLEAYEATALRLAVEGVKNPYIKATYRDPKLAGEFLNNMVESLVKSGYSIDDIRVAPNLRDHFDALKLHKYPSFSVEEAPEEMVNDAENLGPDAEPDLTKGEEAKVKNNQRFHDVNEGFSASLDLEEKLKEINGPLFDMSQKMTEGNVKLSDIDNSEIYKVLERANLLKEYDETTWNKAISEQGVMPHTRDVLVKVRNEFIKYLKLADPNTDTGEKTIQTRQLERLLGAEDILFKVLPEKHHEKMRGIFETLKADGPSVSPEYNPIEAESPGASREDVRGAQPEPQDTGDAQDMNGPQDAGDAQHMNGPQDTGDAQHMNGPQDTGDAQHMNGPQDTGDAQYMNGPQDTGDDQYMNGPQDTGDAQYMNEPQDTGDAQHMNGPQDTGDAQYMNGPQDTGDDQHMNGPQDTGDAQFDNHHGGYEFIGDGESEGAYLDYDESKLSSVKPVASKNNNIELNQQSDLPVNESNAPEDVDPGTIVTNVSKWSEVLGKELSELPIETLREIQALKPNEMLEINSLTPIGEFGFEELSEMKSTISTAKLVMTPWHGEPNNFGDKEWSLAMKLPDDMIPDWLVEPLAEKIKEQNNDVLQVENKEPEIDKNQRSESRRFSR